METEDIKSWIKAYNKSKTLKELRKNLAREGKNMSVVLETYKKGISIGRSEGKIEGLRDVAKNMKEQGFDTDIIIKTTGLSKDEIDLL